MLLDLINFEKLRRSILHLAVILVVLGLQTLLFARFRPMGAAPMFVPAVVVAIGMLEDGLWGGVLGLVTGILCGLRYNGCLLLFALLFPLFGFFSGLLSKYFVNKRFFSYCALCLAAFAITAFCQMFRLLVFYHADPLLLLRTGAFQVLWSMFFPVLIYFPVKNIVRHKRR